MSNYTLVAIPTSSSFIELLDKLLEKYKENKEVYTSLVRLKEAVLNSYIKDYYISK